MTWDTVHDAREAFLACLRAQSSPATPVGGVPAAGIAADPAVDTACALLLSLLDPGLTLAVSGDLAETVAPRLLELTGATRGPVDSADFILVTGSPSAAFAAAQRGTRTQPEASATVIIAGGSSTVLARMTGPGIRTTVSATLPLSAEDLAALALANAEPPRGLDVFLTHAGAVVALPRSCSIELEPTELEPTELQPTETVVA